MIDNDTTAPSTTDTTEVQTRAAYLKIIADAYAPEDCESCEACEATCWECAVDALAEQGMEPDAFA